MSRRLALVVSRTTDDGAGVIAGRLRHLLEAGWDARLFCKGKLWRRERALDDDSLRPHVRIAGNAHSERNPFERRLRRLRPDLLHLHSGWMAWKEIERDRLPDSRLVVSFREDGRDLSVADPELLWRRVDLCLFRNESSAERALELGCPRERAEVLEAPLPEIAWDEPGRTGGPLRLLSVGSLLWENGFEHSIHAVRLLLDVGVPCEYRIVGDGEHVQAVAFARHQLGLTDQVELLSPSDAGELGGADVFVDPAVSDGVSSTPVATAQAHGVPYVASGRPGLPEGGGIAVPRRDPRALADALATLARDPDLRLSMGREGRRQSRVPAPADHAERLEDLYRRVLAV